jgi:hypothetical protein
VVEGKRTEVTDRCQWVSIERDRCEALLHKKNAHGNSYVEQETGQLAREHLYGPPGMLVVELRENASPAVRAIWDEMIRTGTHNIADLPSWRPKPNGV